MNKAQHKSVAIVQTIRVRQIREDTDFAVMKLAHQKLSGSIHHRYRNIVTVQLPATSTSSEETKKRCDPCSFQWHY